MRGCEKPRRLLIGWRTWRAESSIKVSSIPLPYTLLDPSYWSSESNLIASNPYYATYQLNPSYEDVEYRWKMLKDIQLRTKSLVSSVSAVPSPDWPRDVLATADTEECNVGPDYCDQDQTKTSYQDNIELLKPLLQDAGSRSEGQVSSSSMSMYWVWKACSAILLFLALAALIFFLALLCTAF
ncbi:uncharacterized protein LOC129303350 isoform X2 [Prosopis cineraria]|uniref:uncharacterized protein LOC129303350 isoform X2 n=1 Tax=Prosopis cineraria TaxID=364024 RepID=UPI00240FAAD1|nr:uncharacterized protein LOC129303350 isoform X2 [Prosopis cineraria]